MLPRRFSVPSVHCYAIRLTSYFQASTYFMNRPVKAALLSALVFPGVGHFYLKKHIRGAILSGTALAGLFFLVSKTAERALQVAEKIQTGEVGLDVATITELASNPATGGEANLLNTAAMALVVSWLIGVIDSYRICREQDKQVGT